ncbi:hypothetical protein HY837_05575 [archaeon]|nr:hypothetical protein [archaeon]
MEKVLDYPCSCGGKLKQSFCQVEFFGIDFGVKKCEVCTKCGSEFLDDQTMECIESEVKKKKLFGLEKEIQIVKSGNSLALRIPPEIVHYSELNVKYKARIFPSGKKRIEVELI